MPNTRAKQFRVIVQLNKLDLHNNHGFGASTSNGKDSTDEVHMIDCNTLRIVVHERQTNPHIQIDYNMRFDCVCQSSDNMKQLEVESFMRNLFVEQQNSCLMRFTTHAECNLKFLHNLLVNIVNGHLVNLKLEYIEISYCDVQSENIVDMLQSMRSQRHHLHPTPLSLNSCRHNTDVSKQRFPTTWSLLSWLLNNYRSCDVSGHEALEVDFVVTHVDAETGQQASINHTLTVLLVYYANLQTSERSHLVDFFKCGVVNYAHTPLSACMSQYLKPGNNKHSLLLFEVPLHLNGISIGNDCAVELLQLAQAVFVWRNLVVQHITSKQEIANTGLTPKPLKSYHFSVDTAKKSPPETSADTALRHLNELVAGYKKIDDAVQHATIAMSLHFENFYTIKTNQMCEAIKSDPCNCISRTQQVDNSNEYAYYHDYCQAMSELQVLAKEIKRTRYVDMLGFYLKAKLDKLDQLCLKTYLEQYGMFEVRLRQALRERYHYLESLPYPR